MKRLFYMLLILNAQLAFAMEDAGWQARLAEQVEMDRKLAMTKMLCELIAQTKTEDQDAAIQEIQEAIDHGCDVKWSNQNQNTPIAYAVYRGLLDVTKFLISHGADIHGASGYLPVTMLALAIHGCQPEMCDFLIHEKQIDLNGGEIFDWTPLMAITRYIAPCPRQQDLTPEESDHIIATICKTIIGAGADIHAVDCGGRTALDLADQGHNDELFQLLKDSGTQIKSLHDAIQWNLMRTPFIQIRTGANLEELHPEFETTPLMFAASNDRKELCKELILGGANLFAKDKRKMTAIDYANKRGYTLMAKCLEEFQKELLPLSLKRQCINKVRQSVRAGLIPAGKVRELPHDLLEHFEV